MMISACEQRARQLTEAIAFVGLVFLVFQAVAIVADVLLRWIFNSPIFGMEDINQLLLAVILASFFPALLIERSNITIEFLGQLMGAKVSAWFDVFGHLMTLMLFVVVSWQLAVYAIEVRSQTTLTLQLPVSPAWWLASTLIALCIPVQAIVVVVHLCSALNGHSAPKTTSQA